MSKPLPRYSLEEILSVLARNIIASDGYYGEDYKVLSAIADDTYILDKENDDE